MLKLTIYDKSGEKVREAEGSMVMIRFGVIRKLMRLLKVGDADDAIGILGAVTDAWEELVELLGNIFPDVTEEEWENVDMQELIPVLLTIAKSALGKMAKVPSDPNMPGA